MPESILKWRSPSMILSAIGRSPSAILGLMPGYGACCTRPGLCGSSATRTRLSRGAMKRSRWLKGYRIPLASLLPSIWVGALRQFRREARAAQESAEGAIALCTERGLTEVLALATTLRGWAMAQQGRNEEGIAQIQEGLAVYRATGTEVARPYFLCLLAEACTQTGRIDEGLSALTEALAAAEMSMKTVGMRLRCTGSKASCC